MFGIGVPELIVIFVVALIVLGPERLPELARTIAKGIAEFRRTANDVKRELEIDELAPPRWEELTESARKTSTKDQEESSATQSPKGEEGSKPEAPDGPK
ncbi:Sec-independent protein translocase protein TatB [Thermosulfuriphilus sp.]